MTEPPDRQRAWFMERVRDSQARLRASVRALGVRAEAVDDVAQEAYALAWQKMPEFDAVGGDFGGWVAQIARRLVANERRKEGRRNRILSGEVTDILLRRAEEPGGLLEAMARRESVAALRGCLAKLPPGGREMIHWRYFDHLTPGAIAGHLGRPSNAVRQTLLRLRRQLLECMGASAEEGELA